MESTESRFAHLLQPIRELTKNWDIDVASELNDYLEELDEMCITFDGGNVTLNFAEAALLIQGSACIYSKKVELLHNLVYQTLEYINDRNKKRNRQAAASQGDDNIAEAENDADDEAEFTPLEVESSDKSHVAEFNTKISVTPLPPNSLIPPETHEKSRLPLISVKGELLCSQKDFKINLFIPGDNDMIVLISGFLTSCDHPKVPELPAETQQQKETVDVAVAVNDVMGSAEAADDVADDVADAADDFLPVDDIMEQEEHVDRHQAPSEGRMIRERQQPEEDVVRKEPVNVWALSDPYSVCGEEKPVKAGKCYKVPDGLDDGGKRKRKRASSLQDFRTWFRGKFDPPVHKLKSGPTFTDLNYIYLNNMKNKLKTQRRIYRRAGVVVSDELLKRTFLQPEQPELQQLGEEPEEGFRHPDLPDGDDMEFDNDHEAFADDVPAPGDNFLFPESQRDELSYEDLVKLRVDQLVANSQGYTQDTDLSRRVRDWEDKIRPELLLQEERPVFDIHDYSDRIIGSLETVGRRKRFSTIVAGLDNFEACKYLLASLQLANDLTVELDSVSGLEDSVDTVGLTLLSTHRATDRFKTLTAAT